MMAAVLVIFAPMAVTLVSASDTTVFHETWDTAVFTSPDKYVWPNWTHEATSDMYYAGDNYALIQPYALRVFDQDCTTALSGCSMRTSSWQSVSDNSWWYGLEANFAAYLRQTETVSVTESLNMTFWYMNADPGEHDVRITLGFPECYGTMTLLMTAGGDSNTVQFYTQWGSVSPPFSGVVGDLPALDTWYRVTANYNVSQGLAQAFVHSTAGQLLLKSDPMPLEADCGLGTAVTDKIEIKVDRASGYNGGHYHFEDLALVDSEGPGDAALSIDDHDDDGFSDSVERVLCGRSGIRSLLNNDLGGIAGSCTNSTNYVAPVTPGPPIKEIPLPIPNGVSGTGPDDDGDGYPAYVYYETNEFVLNLEDPGESEVRPGDPIQIPVDPKDDDPNIPAPDNSCQLIGVPTAAVTQDDNDEDGVPGSIVVTKAALCVDATTVPPTYDWSEGDVVTQIEVDEDDSDPDNPGLTGMYTTPNIITSVTFGPDADNDKIPAYKRLWHVNYTIDLSDPTSMPTPQAGYTEERMDPDDENRNNPVLFLSSADADGDWIPTIVEPALCTYEDQNLAEDGECNAAGTDYSPPSWFLTVISAVP